MRDVIYYISFIVYNSSSDVVGIVYNSGMWSIAQIIFYLGFKPYEYHNYTVGFSTLLKVEDQLIAPVFPLHYKYRWSLK